VEPVKYDFGAREFKGRHDSIVDRSGADGEKYQLFCINMAIISQIA
jgi:hypothetical protein